MYKLFIDSIEPNGLVIGVNVDLDIPVGTTFNAVHRVRSADPFSNDSDENLGVVANVALTLREVHWFQRSIDAVPRGHNAGLVLAGEGLDSLPGWFSKRGPREFLYLVAPSPEDTEWDPRHTIPKEWLLWRTSIGDELRRCEAAPGLSAEEKERDKQSISRLLTRFESQMQPGDVLWWYASTGENPTGGFAAVRNGEVVRYFTYLICN